MSLLEQLKFNYDGNNCQIVHNREIIKFVFLYPTEKKLIESARWSDYINQ